MDQNPRTAGLEGSKKRQQRMLGRMSLNHGRDYSKAPHVHGAVCYELYDHEVELVHQENQEQDV